MEGFINIKLSHHDDSKNEMVNIYDLLEIKKKQQQYIYENKYLLETFVDTQQVIYTFLKHKPNKPFTIVILNTHKVNNNWKKSKLYLSNYSKLHTIHDKAKYLGSRSNIIKNIVYEPPEININDNKNIEFINGRNRFANLRDLGEKYIPFIVHKNDLDFIKNNLT